MYAYASAYATNQALEADAVSPAAVREALEGRGDFTAVARVDCFHDSFTPFPTWRAPDLPAQRLYLVRRAPLPLAGPGQGGDAAYLGACCGSA